MTYQIETNNWFVLKVIHLFYRLGALRFTATAPEPSEPSISKAEFFEGLRESVEQMKLQIAGKLPEKTGWQMLDDVEKELADE